MHEKLNKLYYDFLKLARNEFRALVETAKTDNRIHLVSTKTIAMNDAVEKAEQQKPFEELVSITRQEFCDDYHGKSECAWRESVKNYFRRSGEYLALSEAENESSENEFDRYIEAFKRQTIEITYIAPLEFVRFSERQMDFGEFQICQMSANEISNLVGNQVNNIFYKRASVDVSKLSYYWFIKAKETIPTPKIGFISLKHFQDFWSVTRHFTEYPIRIEQILQKLVLAKWQPNYLGGKISSDGVEKPGLDNLGWQGFKILFVLDISDNLLTSPKISPDLSRLDMFPILSEDGEEIGEEPLTLISLDQKETESFEKFANRTVHLMNGISPIDTKWEFINIALGYLVKAFCASGMEQLLWHITTIEALLGENVNKLTETLARRLSSILGKTANERKRIKENFKELYKFRCDLIHGNKLKREIFHGHLHRAREFARKCAFWFINYLNEIACTHRKNYSIKKLPTRKELLTILDIDSPNREQMRNILAALPDGFPHINRWLD